LRRHERDTVSAWGTRVGLALAVLGVVGAAVFASSLRSLVHDGSRFGNDYDVVFGNGWFAPPTDLRTTLTGQPDVDGLMLMSAGFARHGDDTVELVGTQSVQGGLTPRLLSGRQPVGLDEIALGRLTAHRLGVGVDDTIELEGTAGSVTFTIVGLAVVPGLGINQGLGLGGILSLEALQALAPDSVVNAAAIDLTPAARADRAAVVARLSELTQIEPASAPLPAPIRNLSRVQRIPIVLSLLLLGLGIVTLVHALVIAVRARRRDLAILRALGADRGQVRRIVLWQATSMVAVPIVIGTPLGLLVGVRIFHVFAERTGAVATSTVPVLVVLAFMACLAIVANLAASAVRRNDQFGLALRTE
jgi:hypothetical protein